MKDSNIITPGGHRQPMSEPTMIFIQSAQGFHMFDLNSVDGFSLGSSGQLDVYLKSGVTISSSTRFLSGKRGDFIDGARPGEGLTPGEHLMNALGAVQEAEEKEDTDD